MRKTSIDGYMSIDGQAFLTQAECAAHEATLPVLFKDEECGFLPLDRCTEAKLVCVPGSAAKSALSDAFTAAGATITFGSNVNGWFEYKQMMGETNYLFTPISTLTVSVVLSNTTPIRLLGM